MKDLSYQNLWGDKKKISHVDALKERVIGNIIDIIADENKVSEKSFEAYDKIIKNVNDNFSNEMFNLSKQMYNEGKRLSYISEFLYDKYFKLNKIEENKVITFTNFLTESKKDGYDFGCMMLYIKLDGIKDIHSKIDKKDIYTEDNDSSYGLEKETHITIKYGFKENVSDHEVLDICRKEKFEDIKFNKISLFENEKFDVLKFDINSKLLNELNEKISKFPNEDKYPEYHAHSTIAYIKKGKGKKYVEMFENIDLIGIPDKLVYSNPDNTKLSLEL